MADETANAPAGGELSDELRRKYVDDLSHRGLNEIDFGYFGGWVLIVWALAWLLANHPVTLGIIAVATAFGAINARSDKRSITIARQREAAMLLPDDALKAAHASHSQSASQRNIIIGIALVALIFGLVFTDRGRAILDSFFH